MNMTQESYRGVPIYGMEYGTSYFTTVLFSGMRDTKQESLAAFKDCIDSCIAHIQHTGEFPSEEKTREAWNKRDKSAVAVGQKWSLNSYPERFLVITSVSPDGTISYQYDDGRIGYSTVTCLPLTYTSVQ